MRPHFVPCPYCTPVTRLLTLSTQEPLLFIALLGRQLPAEQSVSFVWFLGCWRGVPRSPGAPGQGLPGLQTSQFLSP